jgi:SAM-dependent methyltransferase
MVLDGYFNVAKEEMVRDVKTQGMPMTELDYVHGYTERESRRLIDQATTLVEILHADTAYPANSRVLEAGCGIGAQTVTLARNSPGARIVSVDISDASLNSARKLAAAESLKNVTFQRADIFDLPFPPESFDHVFVCFVLEHLRDPVGALACLKTVLKRGGSITVIEGDHGSTYFHPDNREAHRTIQCLIDLQARLGGDALVGRRSHPLLAEVGFDDIRVSPRMVYVDASRPQLVEGFTRQTFIAMVEGVRQQALELGLIDQNAWEKGICGLHRTTASDGVFCYTFFKALAIK